MLIIRRSCKRTLKKTVQYKGDSDAKNCKNTWNNSEEPDKKTGDPSKGWNHSLRSD